MNQQGGARTTRTARWSAIRPGVVAFVAGFLALVLVMVAFGELLVHVVLPGSAARSDNDLNRWLARHRTPFETNLSWVGSHLAETATVIVIVSIVAIVLCARRQFLAALFLLVAIATEAATYLATVQVIDRPRPPVVRLEDLGRGASYPSGHTAASVVVYVGIAVIVFGHTLNRFARRAVVVLAVLCPLAVATARLYRGMHHLTDVLSGALMGFGALAVGLLVARAIERASERRHTTTSADGAHAAEAVAAPARLDVAT
jgi:membrane-associated phospholipid phosphatase